MAKPRKMRLKDSQNVKGLNQSLLNILTSYLLLKKNLIKSLL